MIKNMENGGVEAENGAKRIGRGGSRLATRPALLAVLLTTAHPGATTPSTHGESTPLMRCTVRVRVCGKARAKGVKHQARTEQRQVIAAFVLARFHTYTLKCDVL